METISKILESKTRVQYQDCDPFNHLNNSKYIDYIMAARTEQLLHEYDFNTSELAQKQGIGWVSAQTQISYFYPAWSLSSRRKQSPQICYYCFCFENR